MRKIFSFLLAAALVSACQNDDTDFSEYINGGQSGITTISIAYNGTSVSVTGDTKEYVTTNGADVTVNATNSTDSLLLVLSGSTTDGSLLIFRIIITVPLIVLYWYTQAVSVFSKILLTEVLIFNGSGYMKLSISISFLHKTIYILGLF